MTLGLGLNIRQATERWVGQMDAIPNGLLDKAYYSNGFPEEDQIEELTPKKMVYICSECREEFDEEYYNQDDIRNEDDEPECSNEDCDGIIEHEEDEDENREHGLLPMWGWLWSPENIDQEWIKDNLQKVSDCGFRIYDTEDCGILLGIDGAGYDFYEDHWIPLYKARGLKWHDEEV